MSSESKITLTITIPEDAIRGVNDFMAWADLETFRRVLRSRDTEEAFRLKYAIADIKDAINKATREVNHD